MHWAEASDLVTEMETLAEDAAFPAREVRAALGGHASPPPPPHTPPFARALHPLPHALTLHLPLPSPSWPATPQLAAAVASKCYFHLEEYHDSLRLALCAGAHFDVNARTEYVDTLVARCIDEYTATGVFKAT